MVDKDLRLDAIEFKIRSQERLNAKLSGLGDKERMRRMKAIAENSSLGGWWKAATPAPNYEDVSQSAIAP